MRAYVPGYELVAPKSLQETLDLLATEPGRYRPLAGGTDVMVLYNAGQLDHHNFISIGALKELRGIDVTESTIKLGALTTYTDMRYHPTLQAEFPMLCQASSQSGAVAIQNRGTLGGNIANASPAADTPPALAAYGAEIELLSATGSRRLDYREFHQDYKTMAKKPEELIGAVYLKRKAGRVHYYRKVGTRKAQAISKVCVAATAILSQGRATEVGVALGSVAPTVCLAKEAMALMEGRKPGEPLDLEGSVRADIAPIDDIRSNRDYRTRVAVNLVVDFWNSL